MNVRFHLNKLARFGVAGCVAVAGCCVSYESDVNKLCNLRDTCPDPFEAKGLSRVDRDKLVSDCLSTKLYTGDGRELFASLMSVQSDRTRAALLSHAASKAELDSCPWADELIANLDVPPAPSACTPVPQDAGGIELLLSEYSLYVGDLRILDLPSRESLEQGVDARYLTKGELEIAPLSNALADAVKALVHAGKPVRVSVFASKRLHPMPVKLREQLVHTIRKAGVQDVQQVFLGADKKLCSAPMQ